MSWVLPVCVVALLTGCSGDSDAAPTPSSTSSSASSTVSRSGLSVSEVDAIGKALSSSDAAARRAVLDPHLSAALADREASALPAGSVVRLDAGKAVVEGDVASVPASVTGSSLAGEWMLTLVREGRKWLVISAMKAQ